MALFRRDQLNLLVAAELAAIRTVMVAMLATYPDQQTLKRRIAAYAAITKMSLLKQHQGEARDFANKMFEQALALYTESPTPEQFADYEKSLDVE